MPNKRIRKKRRRLREAAQYRASAAHKGEPFGWHKAIRLARQEHKTEVSMLCATIQMLAQGMSNLHPVLTHE